MHRAICLAELAEAPLYIVHLSAAQSLAAVTEARDRGIAVHAETCPHYLFLSADEYERPGFDAAKYVMTPPLRDHSHQAHLWRGLKTDDLQVVSTDHCPFCFSEQPHGMRYSKQQGVESFARIPNGAPGVETRLPLVFDGAVVKHGMSLNRFVEITATAPAKLFGLFPKKGTIAVGTDGDLVLFDPAERWTIRASRAPQPRRLFAVRRPRAHRPRQEGARARAVRRGRTTLARPRRHGAVPAPQRVGAPMRHRQCEAAAAGLDRGTDGRPHALY